MLFALPALVQTREDDNAANPGVVGQPVFLNSVHVGAAVQDQSQLKLRYEPFRGAYIRPLFLLFTRCIVPERDGVFSGQEFRTNLWDKYSTAAPAQLRPYGLLSNAVRKAYKR